MAFLDIYVARKGLSRDLEREFDRMRKVAHNLRDAKDVGEFRNDLEILESLALKQTNFIRDILDNSNIKK